jgi:hypothetical protein
VGARCDSAPNAAFQDHVSTVYHDGEDQPRDIHALDHPYASLVVKMVPGTDTYVDELR